MSFRHLIFALLFVHHNIGQLVLGGAIYSVEVSAAGGRVGEYTKPSLFYINGYAVEGASKSRGYNVVTVARKSGKVLQKKSYDVWGSSTHASQFVSFIASIPNDTIVLVGNWDESSERCSASCYSALKSIGGTRTSLGFRDTYALLGYKGPPPFPSWVQEAHATYPADPAPVTLTANIHNTEFSSIESVAYGGKIHATLLKESSAHNARHCGLLCSETPKCMSFTFCQKPGLCSLYTGLKTKTFSSSNCVAFGN